MAAKKKHSFGFSRSPADEIHAHAYESAIDSESAYEVLQKRLRQPTGPSTSAPPAEGGILGSVGSVLGSIFGTDTPRHGRLSSGQLIARSVTRTVTNQVAGKVAADIGRSLGGSLGGSIGRAIVRGALGGILRR